MKLDAHPTNRFVKAGHVAHFTDPHLGALLGAEQPPWKLTCLAQTRWGLFAGTCNDGSRHDSRLYLNGALVYQGNDETIGQPIEFDGRLGFAGEKGNLLIWYGGVITRSIPLLYASAMAVYNGKPYVINSEGGRISAINCLTQQPEFTFPGDGIVMQTAEQYGILFAAVADGEHLNGLSGSDGSFHEAADCLAVAVYQDRVIYSSGNRLIEHAGSTQIQLAEFPCEKIMHMAVDDCRLWIAGCNPDSLYCANRRGEIVTVGVLPDNKPVGGSCFRCRVTQGYFGRSKNGNQAEVYQII